MMWRRGLETEVQVKSMLRVPFIFACCLTIVSCAAKTDRNAPVTILDFRTQNVERLHSGIERLVGEDSAGVAAMEYIQVYEEELIKNYPVKTSTVAQDRPNEPFTGVDPYWGGGGSGYSTYARNSQIIFSQLHSGLRDARSHPGMRQLINYLDGRRLRAMADLRKNHGEYLLGGNVANAKMGLVNAYVATTAMPPPNELNVIVDLVEPLLAGLTKK